MAPFEAVIFDMDGVLIDSEPLHFAVLSDLLARAGHTLTRAENEQFIGTTSEAMFSTLIARHGLAGTASDVSHAPGDGAAGDLVRRRLTRSHDRDERSTAPMPEESSRA